MATFGSFLVRLVPAPATSTTPAVVSQTLADSAGLRVGDLLTVPVQGVGLPLILDIVEIVPVVPTAPGRAAILVDLGLMRNMVVREAAAPRPVTDLWIATDADSATISYEVRRLLPANSHVRGIVDPAARAALSAAGTALWAAAAGAALLAFIAVAASAHALRRDRRADVGVLRALGLTPREQGRSRALEQAGVLGYGAVVGALAGAAVVILTVPALARAAVPDAPDGLPTDLALDVVGLGVGVAGLGVALLVLVLDGSRRIARDARRALPEDGAA
jgi:predicted lysophospholipase L1 biosynthesis ABC-type transport system permease subunit